LVPYNHADTLGIAVKLINCPIFYSGEKTKANKYSDINCTLKYAPTEPKKRSILDNMNNQFPNICEYNDFRKYLADYQKARHKTDKTFHKSNVSKLLGLPKTRSYFTDVLRGRQVSTIFIERFIGVLGLNKDESRYFRALVKFNQAESADERELYFDQLISLNRTPHAVIEKKKFEYYKNWYNGTIRALLNIIDFKNDYTALAKSVLPPITTKQAKESVKLLKSLNLVSTDEKGFMRPTDRSIKTPDYLKEEIIKQYQVHSLELAKWCLLKNNQVPQSITTNVISISDEGYSRLDKKIQKFRSEARALVHKDEGRISKVYHFDILLFPNSR
jgi:uncharacterized protein (TIGR02147 family)